MGLVLYLLLVGTLPALDWLNYQGVIAFGWADLWRIDPALLARRWIEEMLVAERAGHRPTVRGARAALRMGHRRGRRGVVGAGVRRLRDRGAPRGPTASRARRWERRAGASSSSRARPFRRRGGRLSRGGDRGRVRGLLRHLRDLRARRDVPHQRGPEQRCVQRAARSVRSVLFPRTKGRSCRGSGSRGPPDCTRYSSSTCSPVSLRDARCSRGGAATQAGAGPGATRSRSPFPSSGSRPFASRSAAPTTSTPSRRAYPP